MGISRPQSETWSGTPRMADGAEKNGVEGQELLEPVLGHHAAGLEIGLAAPVEVSARRARSQIAVRRSRARAMPSGTTSFPDAVAWDHGDLVVA